MTQLEHANITVPSIDAAVEFLMMAAPDFRVKIDAVSEKGYRWIHIGNDAMYLALQEPPHHHTVEDKRNTYMDIGINHLGLIVDNVDHIKSTLVEAGFRENGASENEPLRKRLYFFDHAGFEWELIEYGTDDPNLRYQYDEQPGG